MIVLVASISFNPMIQPFGNFGVSSVYHCTVEHYRDGKLLSVSSHAMTKTNYGLNQTKWLLGQVNATTYGFVYFAVSNDSGTPDATWTDLTGEIFDSGMTRELATYVDVGTGTWNMTLTFNATATVSTKLYGVYSTPLATSNATLCLVEQQGLANQKNMISGDTLKMTVSGTVS
jgi:hypothetical protein